MARKINLNEKDAELYNDVKKVVKQVNQRLVRLERSVSNDTWATKRIIKKLDIPTIEAVTEKGRIRIAKSMTRRQLNAIKKASKEFIISETSTPRGVRNVRIKQREGIRRSLSRDYEDKVNELSDEEIDALTEMFKDDDSVEIMQHIPASDFWALVVDAKENGDKQKNFVERISNYIDLDYVDEDYKTKLRRIYRKFIK